MSISYYVAVWINNETGAQSAIGVVNFFGFTFCLDLNSCVSIKLDEYNSWLYAVEHH
jgi:hypothetical protein